MADDPAGELFQCELARADRARFLARLADLDTDIQHARLLAERAQVELGEAEAEAADLERPSGRNLLLGVTGQRNRRLQEVKGRALQARINRNQMRWLQGSFERERQRLRSEMDAIPSPHALDERAASLKGALGEPVPRATLAQIARAVERQGYVDAREALQATRAAFDQAVDWLGRARRWTSEAEGAYLADLQGLADAEETLESTVRVAGSAAEALTARLRSRLGILPGVRADMVRPLEDAGRDFGLAWARGMGGAMVGRQDDLERCVEAAGAVRQQLDALDRVLKSRGAL